MVERGLSLKKTGLWNARIAHGNMQNDIADSDPQTLFNYATPQLAKRGLAYLHAVEGDTSGNPVPPSCQRSCRRWARARLPFGTREAHHRTLGGLAQAGHARNRGNHLQDRRAADSAVLLKRLTRSAE